MISFPHLSDAEANRLAGDLTSAIAESGLDVTATQTRRGSDTQDLGTSVAILLGTASVTTIARGIAAWIARTGTVVEITCNGSIVAKNIDGRDLQVIVSALARPK
jgi:hypothetical protein